MFLIYSPYSIAMFPIFLIQLKGFFFFYFTLFLTPGARLPVLGPFLAGGAFGSNT